MIRVTIENHPRPSLPEESRWSCFDQETMRRATAWCASEAEARGKAERMGWAIVEDTLFPLGSTRPRRVVNERGPQLALGLLEREG